MRYIFLIIIVCAAIGVFVVSINPRFQKITALRETVAQYQDRLKVAEQLTSSREQLLAKYNSIQKTDLDGIKTLLPDSVDNIRLIIQLNALALQNGLSTVRDVQYDAKDTVAADPNAPVASDGESLPYGTFQVGFTTTGPYKNFLQFLSDMEKNLRIVDIVHVDFMPVEQATGPVDNQTYKVLLKTYWLQQ